MPGLPRGLVLAIFLSLILIGGAVWGFSLNKRLSCKTSISLGRFQDELSYCGTQNTDLELGAETYFVRLERFYLKGGKVFAEANFGRLINVELLLGDVGRDAIYIIQRETEDYLKQAEYSEENSRFPLNENAVEELGKYVGKYATITFFTPAFKNAALVSIEEARSNPETPEHILVNLDREADFWNGCMENLDDFLGYLAKDSMIGTIQHKTRSFFDGKYRECIPGASNLEILI